MKTEKICLDTKKYLWATTMTGSTLSKKGSTSESIMKFLNVRKESADFETFKKEHFCTERCLTPKPSHIKALHLGTVLEKPIFEAYKAHYKRTNIEHNEATSYSKLLPDGIPLISFTVDGFEKDKEGNIIEVIEIKTHSAPQTKLELLNKYWHQCQFYLWATKAKKLTLVSANLTNKKPEIQTQVITKCNETFKRIEYKLKRIQKTIKDNNNGK